MNPLPGKFGINLSAVGFAPFARGGEAAMKKVKALDADRTDDIDVTTTAVAGTRSALQRGAPVTVQAALTHEGWNGRADVLRRVEAPTRIAAGDLKRSQLPFWLFHHQPSTAALADEDRGQRGIGS